MLDNHNSLRNNINKVVVVLTLYHTKIPFLSNRILGYLTFKVLFTSLFRYYPTRIISEEEPEFI